MAVKEELLFDFSINIPRMLICGNLLIVDNVTRIIMFSEEQIVVHNGKKYTSIEGRNLNIMEIQEGRVLITGEPEQVRLLETL